MKLAILISGHVRTWERMAESFKQFVDVDYDLFVNVYDKKYGYAPYNQQIQKFYDDEILTQSHILKMFEGTNLVDYRIDNNDLVDEQIAIEKQKVKLQFDTARHGPDIFYSCYAQYRKLKLGFDMISDYEHRHSIKYDRVFKTRTEVAYKNGPLSNILSNFTELPNRYAIVDSGNTFPNDVLYIADRQSAQDMSTFIYDEFFEPRYDNPPTWPPHSILHCAIKHHGINVFAHDIINHIEREKIQQRY